MICKKHVISEYSCALDERLARKSDKQAEE